MDTLEASATRTRKGASGVTLARQFDEQERGQGAGMSAVLALEIVSTCVRVREMLDGCPQARLYVVSADRWGAARTGNNYLVADGRVWQPKFS